MDAIATVFPALAERAEHCIGESVQKTMEFLSDVTRVAHSYATGYVSEEPPHPVKAAAVMFYNTLRKIWCSDRYICYLHVPMGEETRMTVASMMFVILADLNTFIHGLDAGDHSPRRRALQCIDMSEVKGMALVLFEESVLDYSLEQVINALEHLREMWKRIVITQPVINYLNLLMVRAGYLITHIYTAEEFPETVLDVEKLRKCIKDKGYWFVSEDGICLLEVLFWSLESRIVLRGLFEDGRLELLHAYTKMGEETRFLTRVKWESIAGVPYNISLTALGAPWVNFTERLTQLAQAVTGKNYSLMMKDRASDMFLSLPPGTREISHQQSHELSLLQQYYSDTWSSATQAIFEKTRPPVAVRESLELIRIGYAGSRPQIEYDIAILMLVETMFSQSMASWARDFVVYEGSLIHMLHKIRLHSYPLIIQTCNQWHVLHKDRLWITKEVAVASYVWMYIVWFLHSGVLLMGGTEFDLKEVLQPMFSSQYRERFGGAAGTLDKPFNVIVEDVGT